MGSQFSGLQENRESPEGKVGGLSRQTVRPRVIPHFSQACSHCIDIRHFYVDFNLKSSYLEHLNSHRYDCHHQLVSKL